MRQLMRSCILVGALAVGASFASLAVAAPTAPCSPAADALLAAGQTKAATDAYVKALTTDPELRCAVERLKGITAKAKADASSTAKEGCARAADLAEVGKRKEAMAKYVDILKSQDEECAREGLRELRTDPGWVEETRDWTAPKAAALALAAPLLLLAAVVVSVLFIGITYWGRIRKGLIRRRLVGFRPRVGIAPFGAGGVTPDVSGGVTGLVRMHLRRLAQTQAGGGSDYRLDRVTGVEGIADSIGRLAAVAPQFKALSALITAVPQLARLPRYTLNGVLQSGNDSAGAGLTVILDEQHGQGEGATLWSYTDPGKASSYQALAAGAAGWTDFVIRTSQKLDAPTFTSNAQSFAYLRMGLQLERDGRSGHGRRAYALAIEADPGNVPALLNLSVSAARDGYFNQAIHSLEVALSVLDSS